MKRRLFIATAATALGTAAANVVAPIPLPSPSPSPSPGNSPFATLALGLSAKTWHRMSIINQNSALGVGSISGSMMHYCNQMPWNPKTKCIEIVGMDHNAGAQRYVRFNTNTNVFDIVQADTGAGSQTRHGYGHSTVNPYTGDLYHRMAEDHHSGTGPLVRKFTTSWSNLPRATTLFYMTIAFGSTWWSGSFAGAGAQGCLLLYNSGDSATTGSAQDGGIYAYDPLTNKWFWSSRGMSPFYGTSGATYHSVMAYSAKHNVAVYGGGNDNPKKLWRLNADRSVTPMPNAPTGCTIGVQQGTLTECPATGNFLVLSQGSLFELNPISQAWTKLGTAPINPTAPDGTTGTPIPEYGVTAYITQNSQTNGSFYLYKS